ncbi:PH domain-containing protein [Companilactobacillus ginsenosidimutans]|uniref:YdbS-like PH domain-containing protein n=1 Tax=Companilactobacillus ginsenosidimutans TaxID=1007676 RepID=A0A0H4QHA0_9LACO|nr:PH domain-containing protein [Companilactobacillus ginsenosidimutans]AKP67332.1 hypothetical protein ABM34_07120 [Companilactobacillus ginsenosidimutans]
MISKPRHLHIAALLFFLFDTIKQMVIPFAAGLFGATSSDDDVLMIWIVVVLVLFIIAITVLKFIFFTYQILDDEIIVKYGVFVKKVNHVPYERIQNITTNQWFFLKPFNLEELEIETAGHSDKPEVQLKAVPITLKDEINHHRRNESVKLKTSEVNENVQEKPDKITENIGNTYTISWRDLVKFALTSPAFLTGIVVVLAAYGKIQNGISQTLYKNIAQQASHIGVLIIIGILVAILLVFYIGSVIALIIQYYHFKLTEKDGQFITERGLLRTRKTTIKMDRVQAVMLKQPLLRSFLKIVTVQLVIISNSKKGDSEKDIIVMPVIAQRDVNKFLKQFFPKIPAEQVSAFSPDHRTFFYDLRNATYFALVTVVLTIGFLHSITWLWVTLVIAELLFWYTPAYFSAKRSKVEVVTDDFLVIRNNKVLTNQVFFIPRSSVQFIEKRQSIWLKHKDMSSLNVNVRSGATQKKIKVNYQNDSDIEQIVNWYKH